MPNIGAWEKIVAQKYDLHESWLVPSTHGGKCTCCDKLRRYDHYITDAGVCVFCSVACESIDRCQQFSIFVQKTIERAWRAFCENERFDEIRHKRVLLPEKLTLSETQLVLREVNAHNSFGYRIVVDLSMTGRPHLKWDL